MGAAETPAARTSLHGLRGRGALAILGRMARRMRICWLALTLALGGAGPVVGGCNDSERAAAPNDPWPQGLERPESVAEATALRERGVVWTDRQVRQLYLERAAAIGERDAQLRAQGQTAEARALAAYQTRHDARMTARAMMQDQAEVAALQARDLEKYGDPGGPTFTWLVERAQQKGLEGDAVYESIVESAQQTNAATNRGLGL